jgi:hypothetical protein
MHCSACDAIIVDKRCPQGNFFRPVDERVIAGDLSRPEKDASPQPPTCRVAESMIMKIGGWRMPSVFHRYAIVNRQDMAAAMRQYKEHQARLA